MAEVFPLSDGDRALWLEWLEGLPESARAVARRFWPNRLYRIKSTGHRGIMSAILSHHDGVTLGRINLLVLHRWNPGLDFESNVTHIEPDDLEECDIPPAPQRVEVGAFELLEGKETSEGDLAFRAKLTVPASAFPGIAFRTGEKPS